MLLSRLCLEHICCKHSTHKCLHSNVCSWRLASAAVLALAPGQLATLFMSDAAPAELALAVGLLWFLQREAWRPERMSA